MKKQLLAGAAAIAMMSGAAFAQTVTETSRTTTVAPPIPAPAETYSRTETNSFGGASVEKKQVYKNDGLNTSSSVQEKVVRPDGSMESVSRKEWSNAPAPIVVPPSTTSTTTTITR